MITFTKLREGDDWVIYEMASNPEPYIIKLIGQYVVETNRKNRAVFYDENEYMEQKELDRLYYEWMNRKRKELERWADANRRIM